jgi:hypothetical protein
MSPDFKVMKLTRRGLFLTGGAALLSRGNPAAGPSPNLITLSPSPKDLEMPVEAFIDEITPVDHFLVRCHTMIPQIKLPEWKLEDRGPRRSPAYPHPRRLEETPPRRAG